MRQTLLRTFSIAALILILMIVAISGIYLYRLRQSPDLLTAVQTPPQKFAYGIRIDSLSIVHGKVGNNQSLSTILGPHVPTGMVDRIAKASPDVFDVRKLKAGNTYSRIHTKDSSERTLYFIYEINPIDFVVFDLTDSVTIYKDKKKVIRQVKTSAGTITSSLWNCFTENHLDIGLGLALSDVYAWTIDFYGLQKGDNFKVIYEELYVDGRMVGIDRILAARFQNNGHTFYAYGFQQQGKVEYFDENGQSLQRSFLKAPLKFSRISSRFSRARMHPVLRIVRPHFGVDYSAPKGTPVVALGNGRVTEAGFKGGYGRFISIRHNSVIVTTYAHLSGYTKGIRAGASVSQGEVIGFVGSSGLSTGPHLDFRVYKNGKPVDPLHLESPPSKPVDPQDLKQFKEVVSRMNVNLTKQ